MYRRVCLKAAEPLVDDTSRYVLAREALCATEAPETTRDVHVSDPDGVF